MAWTDRRGIVISDGKWTAAATSSPDVVRIKRGAQRGTDNQRPMGRHKVREYYAIIRAGVANAKAFKRSK